MIGHSRPTIGNSDWKILQKVLSSARLCENGCVRGLERRLKAFIGARFALAANSGTSALHLILLGLGVTRGDRVLIPSYVCSSLLNAIMYLQAKPVVCDIDAHNYNLSFAAARPKITKKVKAIILPYMFGGTTDIDKFLELGVPLVEDCAQSLGATYRGKRLGGFGAASLFSFYATKVITTGQGGMILTNSPALFSRVKNLIEYDERQDYIVRYNYKMTDLQAALGLVQLKQLNGFIAKRRAIARYYDRAFSRYGISVAVNDPGHIYYRYVIRINSPLKQFAGRLRKKGIEAKPPVFMPLHRYLGLERKLFPNTEEVFKTALSLPIYPALTASQIKLIARSVIEAL